VRDDRQRLLDIVEALEKIARHTAAGREAFDTDELVQTWVLHHLQILGEAAGGLSGEFRGRHPEIPWRGILGMRNILVHHYFEIDKDAVWSVVEKDLPGLKSQIQAILAEGWQ
jgi:uncharacterized protein with HEPN domain